MTGIRMCFASLLCAAGVVVGAQSDQAYDEWSIGKLEHRLSGIDEELAQLASFSWRSGVGALGYRSQTYPSGDQRETVQINLEREAVIDLLVLAPTIWRDTNSSFRADGFPQGFRIVAGRAGDTKGKVIATYRESDGLLPRIAPLVIPCEGVKASWIRLETSQLSARAWDGKYVLQLSEIFVFSGQENVALRQKVQVSSPGRFQGEARRQEYLVDGLVPYLMDAAQGEQSAAFVSKVSDGITPSITFDLGASHPVDHIHLHATDVSDWVPQAVGDGFGMPGRMTVEGADKPDFSDAVQLLTLEIDTVYDTGPIVMRNFEPKSCRYIRLKVLEPFASSRLPQGGYQLGFAEVEIFANGKNVALHRPARADFAIRGPERKIESLTDGRNLYGKILPIRGWMSQLARRHELERERPHIIAALDHKYTRQQAMLDRLKWLVALLAVGLVFTILIERLIRMRQVERIRMRLAADLHDELGANIHTIGLLSDLASETTDDSEELATLHRRIRSETERSGTAVRNCTNMLEAEGLYEDLREDMKRASRRIMAQLDHDIVIQGEPFLNQLRQRTRVDLYLFYKESLINISRHAHATRFKTRLIANRNKVRLTVSDNGRGLDGGEVVIPKSLQRRAKLLGAHVEVEVPENGGTRIILNLPIRKWGFLKIR